MTLFDPSMLQRVARVARANLACKRAACAAALSLTPMLTMALAAAPALSADFQTGQAPVKYWAQKPLTIKPDEKIVVEGRVIGSATKIVIRVDDRLGPKYADRFNLNLTLNPGPFSLAVPARALTTPSGRALDLSNIRQLVVFPLDGGRVSISRFATRAEAAAEGVKLLGAGPAPIIVRPRAPLDGTNAEVFIRGEVTGQQTIRAVVRVDDGASTGYATRANVEREFPPGPFRLRVAITGLKATNGRVLNAADLRLIAFWPANDAADIKITEMVLQPASLAGRPQASARGPSQPAVARQPQREPAPARPRTNAKPNRAAPEGTIRLPSGVPAVVKRYAKPQDFSGREAVISGRVTGPSPKKIVLRIDDGLSNGYANRVNIERSFPPGPFSLRVGLDGLKTSNKRPLNAADVRLIAFWPFPQQTNVVIERFDLVPLQRLPGRARGYALRGPDAPLPPGFERIGPDDARVSGRNVRPRTRPMPDPVISSGLRGVTQIRLPADPGRYRVTVWSEDTGEWEFLPHALKRRITVNGRVLLAQDLTPADWIAQRYLRGLDREHTVEDDAWTAFGRDRGARKSVEVLVRKSGIVVDVQSINADGRFISAILVEPVGSRAALNQVIRYREDWYRSNWRIAPTPAPVAEKDTATSKATDAIAVSLASADRTTRASPKPEVQAPDRKVTARGTDVRVTFQVTSTRTIDRPRIRVLPLKHAKARTALGARAWAGQYRLTRRPADGSLLRLTDHMLRPLSQPLALRAGQARRIEVWVKVPTNARPGLYQGALEVADPDRPGDVHRVPFTVDVLPMRLPRATKPAGFYFGYPPHLSWLGATRGDRRRQAQCDMQRLVGFGLTGNTAAVETPLRGGTQPFIEELDSARKAGFAAGPLLYDPLRALQYRIGLDRTAKFTAALLADLRKQGGPMPVFTGADEPSNPSARGRDLVGRLAALRRAAGPGLKLAGHLNTPGNKALAGLFDVIVINHGYGIDRKTIAVERAKGRTVWIYNTQRHRLTAGAWLHTTAAERYIQWHANLPTADPFDPLDGREGDSQVIYPAAQICPRRAVIDRDLLDMADGVIDQRWLIWLDQQDTAAARRLARQLRDRIGATWANATKLTRADLEKMRQSIIALAAGTP